MPTALEMAMERGARHPWHGSGRSAARGGTRPAPALWGALKVCALSAQLATRPWVFMVVTCDPRSQTRPTDAAP